MPRKAKTAVGANSTNQGTKRDSVGGYFREIFDESPKLLKTRSNEEILDRWLADHPGEKVVPERIKNILANVKSVLRHQKRRKKRRNKQEEVAVMLVETQAAPVVNVFEQCLEQLEEHIDECLMLARSLDQDRLASIIRLLRRARHEVVWQLGE